VKLPKTGLRGRSPWQILPYNDFPSFGSPLQGAVLLGVIFNLGEPVPFPEFGNRLDTNRAHSSIARKGIVMPEATSEIAGVTRFETVKSSWKHGLDPFYGHDPIDEFHMLSPSDCSSI
jgi:hypothetical protein